MKNVFYVFSFVMLALSAFGQSPTPADSTGLPGDHFSLQGALELFKNAASPEEFEKQLNTEENHVNNLDLNGDGETDYIKVNERQDNDARVLVLQVPVSENENQDIAVIELDKTKDGEAIVQIIGDEDMYGEEIILEPSNSDDKTYMYEEVNEADSDYEARPDVVVNVWAWPCVRFMYGPAYRPWVSPWRWRYYPGWYRPWRPFGWAVWHPFRAHHFRTRVHVVHTHRVVRAHSIYRPNRVTSVTVRTRHANAHSNYKVSRTKTKVTGPRGNSVTKKTTTVRGPKGHVKAQKTTIKKSRKR